MVWHLPELHIGEESLALLGLPLRLAEEEGRGPTPYIEEVGELEVEG